MKSFKVLLLLGAMCFLYACMLHKTNRKQLHDLANTPMPVRADDEYISLPRYDQPPGDPVKGFEYLKSGEYISSGIPAGLYKWIMRDDKRPVYQLMGYSQNMLIDFNVYTGEHGKKLAAPGCLQCHSTIINDSTIIGLGNSFGYYTTNTSLNLRVAEAAVKAIYGKNSGNYKGSRHILQAGKAVSPLIVTEAWGVNPAERIAEVIAVHRDPRTLSWNGDTSYFPTQQAVIPTDVPAWWLLKKKNAMYYNANGRGSFAKQIMAATLLTLNDTVSANRIHEKMKDVLAYLRQLQPPPYPKAVNNKLVLEGKALFNDNCARCHGTYGKAGSYPNIVVSQPTVGTDSLMAKQYFVQDGYTKWYNNSWFSSGDGPAWFQPEYGYIAPPLDGVWITAPYFHNGAVPTIEAVLNSKLRPEYWTRNFNRTDYDYEKLGWKYQVRKQSSGNRVYNTNLPGYGNYGHTFGDELSKTERDAVIEYLKTL
ncbi:c-type cytochrome [Segetibacter sp. 3557_3]|uniref:c-type cytochrome n=1 Tax=Segetibacter sp. 3557_3 TaxID=2547429 RepID=UPI001058F533|nr:c-type cytochrome [Segetibacter sp. 3557_3]TDH25562.1 c-type cytochrome [Segetibacter sp. 3557_3]